MKVGIAKVAGGAGEAGMPKGRKWTRVARVAKNQSGGMARVAGAGVENVDRQRGAMLEGIQGKGWSGV